MTLARDMAKTLPEKSILLLEPITFYFLKEKKSPPLSFSSLSFNSTFPLLDHLCQHELTSPNLTHTIPPATSQSLCSTLTILLLEKSVYACCIHHLQSSSLINPLQVEFCNITTPAFYLKELLWLRSLVVFRQPKPMDIF